MFISLSRRPHPQRVIASPLHTYWSSIFLGTGTSMFLRWGWRLTCPFFTKWLYTCIALQPQTQMRNDGVYTDIHTYIPTYIFTYIHTHTHTYIYIYTPFTLCIPNPDALHPLPMHRRILNGSKVLTRVVFRTAVEMKRTLMRKRCAHLLYINATLSSSHTFHIPSCTIWNRSKAF